LHNLLSKTSFDILLSMRGKRVVAVIVENDSRILMGKKEEIQVAHLRYFGKLVFMQDR